MPSGRSGASQQLLLFQDYNVSIAALSLQLRGALCVFALDHARHIFCSHVVVGGFDDYGFEALCRAVHGIDYTRGHVRAQVENDISPK